MFKVPAARPFEVAVNPLFSLITCLLASLHSDSAPPRVCGSAGEARVCHLHARSIFLTHSLTGGCVFYKFSSSKNNERARHVLSGKRTWHYFSTVRDDALMSACASARDIFYCTIKRPSNNNNSHVTALAHTHANANAALGRYGNVNG